MDLRDRLSYLFGTEENVNLRRQLVLLREKLMNDLYTESVRYICSGSLGEGVSYPFSDDDVMYYNTSTRVVREAERIRDLLMLPSEYSPGYCLLFDVNQSLPRNLIYVFNERSFVSSSLWKQNGAHEGESIHGPCHTQIVGGCEYDQAFCISCAFWPDVANNWVVRNRPNNWPSHELIQNIVEQGCQVVPIGDTDSPFRHHEWRISFSVAERTLMHSMNHVQFLTYNILRLCLKRVIGRILPDVLCSYFMKTALFFTCERTTTQDNQAGDIETCFKSCLSVLYDNVDHRNCPNYFIPEYNMIKGKINDVNRDCLLNTIRTLHEIGIVQSIYLCGESICLIDNLSLHMMENKLDDDFMFSDHVEYAMTTLMLWIFNQSYEEPDLWKALVRKLEYSIHGLPTVLQNLIFRRGIIYCCYHMTNYALSYNGVNKRNYRLFKTIETLHRKEYRADVTTGKLAMATYMYIIGKTESALSHLRRLLSEYPLFVKDKMPNDIKRTSYMEIMCGRGYTIDYKLRHAHAPVYHHDVEALHAYPLPLHIWISTLALDNIDPLSYAYFLESLCYIRLRNRTSLKKSTRCLVNHMDDLKIKHYIVHARMCVGITKYEHGDEQSATRWLGSAYIMKDVCFPPFNERISVSILTYIACLLNRRFV